MTLKMLQRGFLSGLIAGIGAMAFLSGSSAETSSEVSLLVAGIAYACGAGLMGTEAFRRWALHRDRKARLAGQKL